MNKNKELSTTELINKGWFWINIPAILIILVTWYCLVAYFEINGKISTIIGGALGWIYWELTIKKWIRWALENNVEPDRLLKIGKVSLLLWNNKQINEVLGEMK